MWLDSVGARHIPTSLRKAWYNAYIPNHPSKTTSYREVVHTRTMSFPVRKEFRSVLMATQTVEALTPISLWAFVTGLNKTALASLHSIADQWCTCSNWHALTSFSRPCLSALHFHEGNHPHLHQIEQLVLASCPKCQIQHQLRGWVEGTDTRQWRGWEVPRTEVQTVKKDLFAALHPVIPVG